jgi:hypothetical protein
LKLIVGAARSRERRASRLGATEELRPIMSATYLLERAAEAQTKLENAPIHGELVLNIGGG